MQISANGSKGHHKFTLNVSEDKTNGNSSYMGYSFTIAPIQTSWDWYDWGSKISYKIKFTEDIIDEETKEVKTNELYKKTGTIPNYDGYSTVNLSNGSNIEIPHDNDGTKKINISFEVVDNADQKYTCGNAGASGSMELTQLHKAPIINNVTLVETNSKLTELNVSNETIVQYLSKKKFTISASYDNATIKNCSIYYNNMLIGTSTTNEITIDFFNVGELITTISNEKNYVGLSIVVTDSKNAYSTKMFNFEVIKYTIPTIEATSTSIKRKTGNGIVLTDNKAVLNFVGTCYKGNDVIGNANMPTVEYKIWNNTEPDYSSLTVSNVANILIQDLELSNIVYTNVYTYKFKINDVFTNSNTDPIERSGKVPTGKSVFTEYKDRVDFEKITVGGYEIIDASSTANDMYIKYSNGSMLCIGTSTTDTLTWTQDGSIWHSRNLTLPDFPQNFIEPPRVIKSIQSMNSPGRNINICGNSEPTSSNPGTYNLDTYWNASDTKVTVSYFAMGNWK